MLPFYFVGVMFMSLIAGSANLKDRPSLFVFFLSIAGIFVVGIGFLLEAMIKEFRRKYERSKLKPALLRSFAYSAICSIWWFSPFFLMEHKEGYNSTTSVVVLGTFIALASFFLTFMNYDPDR